MNVITCPSVEDVYQKTLDALTIPEGDFKRFARRFAEMIGGTQKVAPGINLAWELSVYDIEHEAGAMPLLGVFAAMDFDKVMTAVFPAEFAAEVISIRKEIVAEVMAKAAESTDLTTPEGVVNHMRAATSESDWNSRCNAVKRANGGYPSFWFMVIMVSGVAKEVTDSWK